MPTSTAKAKAYTTLDLEGFERLLSVLAEDGYRVIGPRIRDGTIVYDDIGSTADLPIGCCDEQEPGAYRLRKTDSPALFGYTLSPQSWKRFLFPPEIRLWQASHNGADLQILSDENENHYTAPRFAFIGVRPCELRAIAIQDRVFLSHDYPDPIYKARRENAFIVTVNCKQPGKTCFCASMGAGPQAREGFDLALTEVVDANHHYFVVEVGSERGAAVMESVPQHRASDDERQTAADLLDAAAQNMGRTLNTGGIKEVLYASYDHPQWDSIASHCLACGNCTMVCPTCFCTTVEDVTDLAGEHAEHWRKWDSCFTLDFSYIFGGSIRTSTKSRYRQWLMHKMATWSDQFDTMGCVGCGRCITWCPVGIDITEEVRAIQDTQPAAVKRKKQRA
jgi:sulfhydrogenase subunit beta (sulfur reductase)